MFPKNWASLLKCAISDCQTAFPATWSQTGWFCRIIWKLSKPCPLSVFFNFSLYIYRYISIEDNTLPTRLQTYHWLCLSGQLGCYCVYLCCRATPGGGVCHGTTVCCVACDDGSGGHLTVVDVVFNHRSWPFVRVFPPLSYLGRFCSLGAPTRR